MLHTEPTADVFIVFTSADATEGLPYADSLRFTADTWDTPQDIRLIGQNDYVDEGDIAYTVAGVPRSNDTKYNDLSLFNLSATNTDDDTAAVNVKNLTPKVTTEGGFSHLFELTEPHASKR